MFKIAVLTLVILINHTLVSGQSAFDSVMFLRNKVLSDYKILEEENALRPWIKPTELNLKAKALIDVDNSLINFYLYNEIEKNKSLSDRVDNLMLEVALSSKESELKGQALNENKTLINILIVVAGILFLMLVVSVIFFIDRHIRLKSLSIEMEKTWPLKEEINRDRQLQDEMIKLNRKVEELNLKNSSLTGEIQEVSQKLKEKELILAKEISSKMQIEDEIKKLIIQIKSQ